MTYSMSGTPTTEYFTFQFDASDTGWTPSPSRQVEEPDLTEENEDAMYLERLGV